MSPHDLNIRALLVEDNPTDALLVRALLEQADHPSVTVREAVSLEEALALLRTGRFDVVLLDLFLPDARDLQAVERVCSEGPPVPIVVLTIHDEQRLGVEALHIGAQDYLIKAHISPEALLRSIRFAIERHRREAAERSLREERLEGEKRAQAMRVIELEHSRLSSLFEHAPAAIALLHGPQHVFQLSNAHCDELIGHRDILGRPIREALPELDGQGCFEMFDRVAATGMPHIGAGSRVLLRRKESLGLQECFLNFVARPFLGVDGISGIFVHAVDVTSLVHAREAAEAASLAKSEFLSRASHELRTPLNAILGFGQLLEVDAQTEESRECVAEILSAGRKLLKLVDEVLDIAQIEAGQMRLPLESVPVRRVLQESLELVRHSASGEAIELRALEGPVTERFIWADEPRLKQVLLHLLTNAIKYNRPNGSVTVSAEEFGGDSMRLVVHDTGTGIPAEKLDRLFTPFDRLGAERRGVDGQGLGLALSKGLVEAMGGALGLDCRQGEGTRFWLEFALAPAPAEPEAPGGASLNSSER